MPTKKNAAAPKKPAATKGTKKAVVASTPVRYSALPKLTAPAAKAAKAAVVTDDMIARKAYELFAAGIGGNEQDHWFAAEAELRTAA